MKKMIMLTGVVLFGFTALAQKKAKKVVLKNQIDSVSYLMGVNIGNSLGKEMSEANFELIIQGFRDAVAKGRLVCQDSTDMVLSMYFRFPMTIRTESNFLETRSIVFEHLMWRLNFQSKSKRKF